MLFLNLITAAACVYILSVGLAALNRMSKTTDYKVRIAHLALVGGAAAQLVWSIDYGHLPNRITGTLFTVAVALFLSFNRRRPA